MKGLRCPNCPGARTAPGIAALPDGTPYLMGRAPSEFPFRYSCAACHHSMLIYAADFSRLPELTIAELEKMEALTPLLKDLRGAGFADNEARALFVAGHDPVTIDVLARFHAEPPDTELDEIRCVVRVRLVRRIGVGPVLLREQVPRHPGVVGQARRRGQGAGRGPGLP